MFIITFCNITKISLFNTTLRMRFTVQGTYVTTVTARDGDKMLNAPVEYFVDSGRRKYALSNIAIVCNLIVLESQSSPYRRSEPSFFFFTYLKPQLKLVMNKGSNPRATFNLGLTLISFRTVRLRCRLRLK